MAINERASSDARHARTGKDAGLYDEDGNLLASMESFSSKVTYNNVKYRPLGDPQEHETSDSYGIAITVTEIVIEDIDMFITLMDALKSGITPQFVFQGCWIYKLSDDGRGVVEASLRLDGEDNGNFSYRYVTYDNLGRSTTLTIVNEMGSAIGEVLEYEFDGASGVVTAIDYRNADTGELSQRAQYERREDGKTEKIHWYLPSGDELAIAYYDENEKFLGWDDSF